MLIQSANVGRGLAWITEALPYFTRNPLGWIAAMIVLFIISIVLGIIPFGSLVINILYPVVVGGYMLGCAAHQQGDSFEFQHIFAGFQEAYFKRLAMLGVIYLVATILVIILLVILVIVGFGGMEFLQQLEGGQIEDVSSNTTEFMLLILISATLFLPLIMAMWFAPVIIIHSDESSLSAMMLSFNACLKNILPFTLYGLIVFILAILAAIPIMLGYLILLPVLSASVYVAFLDCFNSE